MTQGLLTAINSNDPVIYMEPKEFIVPEDKKFLKKSMKFQLVKPKFLKMGQI